MLSLLAATGAGDPIGKIDNPLSFGNDVADLGKLISLGIRMFFIVGAIAVVVYMLWGAFNWVTSSGDKEKVQKAQGKIRNAIIGIMIMVAMVAVFATLMQTVLGGNIVRWGANGLEFDLPTLNNDRNCCTLRDCSTSSLPPCATQ